MGDEVNLRPHFCKRLEVVGVLHSGCHEVAASHHESEAAVGASLNPGRNIFRAAVLVHYPILKFI